jgi:uncharacterized protein (TIGR02452 family)
MSRELRMKQARETAAICDAGHYLAPGRKRVEIADALAAAKQGTMLYSPETPLPPSPAALGAPVRIAVNNETTFSAVQRLAAKGAQVCCLNFASAKNPGGGFLNGAQAQEEALARASALYPCLLMAPEYYERNRANRSAIYLDLVIFSPQVPFFRDDEGTLLEAPVRSSVITAPAPNAGAVAQNEPRNLPQVEPALKRRAELVLRIAQAHGVRALVLGAWGCGVFRNDPARVAAIFRDLLKPGAPYATAFSEVVFAVLDRSEGSPTCRAFAAQFTDSLTH